MGDLDKEIKEIVDSINDYVDGNDSEENYEVILSVVDGLHEYIKLTKKNKLRATVVFLVSKVATFISSPALMKEDLYKDVISSCKMDYDFYLESVERLKNYVNECDARGEYPDLDAAYLLSINLSLVFRACMRYVDYVRTLENCYRNDVAFQTDIKNSAFKEKEEVKKLLMITDSAIEELKKGESL